LFSNAYIFTDVAELDFLRQADKELIPAIPDNSFQIIPNHGQDARLLQNLIGVVRWDWYYQ